MKALFLFLAFSFFGSSLYADWMIDFSRRQKDLVEKEKQVKIYREEKKSVLDMLTDRQGPMLDIAILNTEKGFYPKQIQVKRNQRYRVHVVNINKKHKNISFMLDAYSQHHGTFFGEEVVFEIEPRKEGLFDFHCPETLARGKFVVYSSDAPIESPLESIKLRRPASE